ncbi:Uncharacterised protein [Shigella sonnei]|nr:Uncharacterised protein [Shigella sonnei]CSF77025.1 Uncharacterised protein [Shigella sonnei]CSF90376.1 Uncharacterised protein [Shigella sonnei]CSG25439.1 Uncharacterised protein [Shigella sonnei]
MLQNIDHEHPTDTAFMLLDHRNQGNRQKDRHWIITAGFNFQRRANTFVKPLTTQQRKDRCSIGRADDSAD